MKRLQTLVLALGLVASSAYAAGTPGNPQPFCVHNYAGVAAATLNAALYSAQFQNNVRVYGEWTNCNGTGKCGQATYFVNYVANPTTDTCPTGGWDVEIMNANGVKYPNDYAGRNNCSGAGSYGYHANGVGPVGLTCKHMNNRTGPFAVVAADTSGGYLSNEISHELGEMAIEPWPDGYNPPTVPFIHEPPNGACGVQTEIADPVQTAQYVDPLDPLHGVVSDLTTPLFWGYSTTQTHYDIMGTLGMGDQVNGQCIF